jgi:hypothetical protein
MIVEYENKILTQLGWRLHPPTANMWANRISQHWDDYTEAHMLPLSLAESIQSLKFRCQDSSSYVNLRSLYQYIDLCILDIHSLRYRTREVSASFLYLILITKLGVYSIK